MIGCHTTTVTTPPPPDVPLITNSDQFANFIEGSGERTARVADGVTLTTTRTLFMNEGNATLLKGDGQYKLQANGFGGQMIIVQAPNVTLEGLYVEGGFDCLSLQQGARDIRVAFSTFTDATDENVEAWGAGIDNVIFENNIVAFAADPNSFGMLVGGGANNNWIIRNNLFAYNNNRNPYAAVNVLHFYNNFIYRNKARGIQAFGRYVPQAQFYYDNYVHHQNGVEGSWGSANAGSVDGGTLQLGAEGNLDNTSRTSLSQPEREFWSDDVSDGTTAGPYTGGFVPIQGKLSSIPADQVWQAIRSDVGACLRDTRITNMIAEIDQQVGL